MNAEQGFQFGFDGEHFKHDTWINWRIREGVIRAEDFLVRVHGGYFSGNDFLARRGDPLYGLEDYIQGGARLCLALVRT